MDVNEILNGYTFYNKLSESTKSEMLECGVIGTLSTGDRYFSEGEECKGIAFVGRGDISVYKIGENGRKIILYTVGPGESCVLTATCLINGSSYPAFGDASAPVEAVIFPTKKFLKWVDTDKAVRLFLFSALTERMANIMNLVEEIAFGKIDRRVATFLNKEFKNSGVNLLTINISHENIAEHLGTAREVVSRSLKRFEKDGIINLSRNKITLLNKVDLKKLTEMI